MIYTVWRGEEPKNTVEFTETEVIVNSLPSNIPEYYQYSDNCILFSSISISTSCLKIFDAEFSVYKNSYLAPGDTFPVIDNEYITLPQRRYSYQDIKDILEKYIIITDIETIHHL